VVRKAPSSSAQNVAMVRAHLTWLGILDDRWARPMLRPRWAVMERALRWPLFSWWGRNRTFSWLAARTRFFDDAVTDGLDAGIRQVVIVAAGYDSRAWRLARPGVRFFEVDHPATQEDKRRRAPVGGPVYVPVDLQTTDLGTALTAGGFEVGQPTSFVVEGLTMYLTEEQVRDLFVTLEQVGGAGSRLAVNFGLGVEATSSRSGRTGATLHRVSLALGGERITFRPTAERAADVLAGAGWTVRETLTAPELVQRHLAGTAMPVDGIKPIAFAMNCGSEG
jgi:methyltransferase (TIGR00027 family)